MLNLEWFRTFKAIYETGNLTAAAHSLFISQPGVSLHLNSLESYTGHRLFERETRKMVPTERGVILYNYILDPLNKLQDAEQSFFRNSTVAKPTVSVGMGYEMFEHTLEKHLSQLPFNLILRFGEYSQLRHDLDAGKLDLIVTPQKERQGDLEYTPFTTERIVMICGRNTNADELQHLVMANDRSSLRKWLKQQVWYATTAEMEHLQHFWLTNFDCLPDLRPNFIVPYFSSILRCLRDGNGFAVMPDLLCRRELQNKSIKLAWEGSPYIENVLHFCKRKKNTHSSEIRQLEELLIKNRY